MFSVFIPVFALLQQLLVVASIEAPLALLQKPVEIVSFDAIKFTHLPLCLVSEILDAIDVIRALGKQLTVVDSLMVKTRNIQRIVAVKMIGIDDAVRGNFLLNDWQQRLGFGIWNDSGIHLY